MLLAITHTDSLSDRQFNQFVSRHTRDVQRVLKTLKWAGHVVYYNEVTSPASRQTDIVKKATSSGKSGKEGLSR